MKLGKAELEHWMREYYFDCEIDLGSSGVHPYTFGDICSHSDISLDKLSLISLGDSKTVGDERLRQVIADRYGHGDPRDVMLANGSNEILYHILSTILEPGDQVIALEPIYHALDAVPIAKNCELLRWEMKSSDNFRVCFSELENLITQNTKLIAVNFPHNPTGVTISQDELDELIRLASSVDAYLLWDAACEELTDNKLANPYLTYNKAISVGTMSKSFGMPGLRVGWCFANQYVIENCVELRDYTTLYVSPIIEYICECVMRSADYFINHRMQDVVENRRALSKWVEQKNGIVEWSKPQGGVSSLVRFRPIKQVDEFCISLAKEQSVMVVPGSCFNVPDFARVGFGESREKFQEGLSRLDTHLSQFLK